MSIFVKNNGGFEGIVRPHGDLVVTKIDVEGKPVKSEKPAPLSWKIRNMMRRSWWLGNLGLAFVTLFDKPLRSLGLIAVRSELRLIHIDNQGNRTDYGVVSRHVVTDAGVAFIVDTFDNTVEAEIMNYHGSGTGTTAEAANQTALVTESTTALNPDNTRPTGTQSQPSANIYRTTATATYDASAAITEHGIFSQAATGGGTLLDRSVFSAVNVVSGESIQFQYSLTFPSGS